MKRFLGAVVLGGLGAAAVAAVLARARTAAGFGRRIGADGTARTGAADGKGRVTMGGSSNGGKRTTDAHDPLGRRTSCRRGSGARAGEERLVGARQPAGEREACTTTPKACRFSGSQGETPGQSDRTRSAHRPTEARDVGPRPADPVHLFLVLVRHAKPRTTPKAVSRDSGIRRCRRRAAINHASWRAGSPRSGDPRNRARPGPRCRASRTCRAACTPPTFAGPRHRTPARGRPATIKPRRRRRRRAGTTCHPAAPRTRLWIVGRADDRGDTGRGSRTSRAVPPMPSRGKPCGDA
jgi:hypothetical protein